MEIDSDTKGIYKISWLKILLKLWNLIQTLRGFIKSQGKKSWNREIFLFVKDVEIDSDI